MSIEFFSHGKDIHFSSCEVQAYAGERVRVWCGRMSGCGYANIAALLAKIIELVLKWSLQPQIFSLFESLIEMALVFFFFWLELWYHRLILL